MSINSSHSQSSNQLVDFKQEMMKIKLPFMQNIKKSAQTFHTKIKAFEQKITTQQNSQTNSQNDRIQPLKKKIYSSHQVDTQQNANEKQNQEPLTSNIQFQLQKYNKKGKRPQLPLHLMKQWQGNNKFCFGGMEQVKQNFINVFNKKLSVKKKESKKKFYDFKEDEKNMLQNIFHQLQNPYGPNKGFANIQKIVQFFEQNQLFYLFYNLHPNRIKYVLKQFARTKPDGLTEIQFLHVFFMDRPLLTDLSDPYQKIVHRKCIIENQVWGQLKKLFNTLDTFGNQTIYIQPFFQKLKVFHSNPRLIYTPVIQFPQIQRVYTLKKIVFDLEHKFEFKEKVQWKDIEEIIQNFNHKEEPTLDAIFQKHLQKATILLDSNYFLLDKKTITFLKNIFQKCPKFSEFFINTKFICNQILQSQDLKVYLKNPIRQKTHIYGGYISLEDTVRYMATKAPNYLDLDEFLQYFSIKGPITNVLLEKYDQLQASGSESDQNIDQIRKLHKIRSMEKLHKQKKKLKCKKPIRQVTDFCQFNLTRKQKETIRQKKLKQMLKQLEQKQIKQLKAKFKANPIPADLNPERLKQQQKRMQMQKRKKLQQIAKQRQQDKQIISYLKANTKLFQPINKQITEQAQNGYDYQRTHEKKKKFTHKPVPWYVQENLLEKINRQKSERKKLIYQEAKLKYVRSWNKLPDFFFHDQQQQNSAENSIVEQLRKKNYEITHVKLKASPVPNFKQLHRQFQASLQKKKKQFQPTKIEQFKLASPKVQKKEIHSYYLSPQNKTSKYKKWRQTLHSPPANKIVSTKKTEDWMKLNRKIQQQKQAHKQIEKLKQKERILKQKNFAKFMSDKLRMQAQNLPDLQAQTALKLKNYKKTVKYLQRETQRQLSQIYARVLQRPFLFEQNLKPSIKKELGKGKLKKKQIKRAVIKNIQPIDMNQEQKQRQLNNNNQFQSHNYNENDNSEQYEMSHEGLNQSF